MSWQWPCWQFLLALVGGALFWFFFEWPPVFRKRHVMRLREDCCLMTARFFELWRGGYSALWETLYFWMLGLLIGREVMRLDSSTTF